MLLCLRSRSILTPLCVYVCLSTFILLLHYYSCELFLTLFVSPSGLTLRCAIVYFQIIVSLSFCVLKMTLGRYLLFPTLSIEILKSFSMNL
jgi:hypothetical protein